MPVPGGGQKGVKIYALVTFWIVFPCFWWVAGYDRLYITRLIGAGEGFDRDEVRSRF